jgi:hypothetical protein
VGRQILLDQILKKELVSMREYIPIPPMAGFPDGLESGVRQSTTLTPDLFEGGENA